MKIGKPPELRIAYLNRYNFNIFKRYWLYNGFKSAMLLSFILVATSTFGILGSLVVFFVANTTIIIRGFQLGIWRPHGRGVNVDEIKSKRGNRNK